MLLSHGNLLANAKSILSFLPIRQSDRALALLPFCHAYGNSVLQTHVLAGASLILDGSTTFPNTIVDALERHEASSFAGVPEMYCALSAGSDLGVRHLPHLRYMTVAGAALAPAAAVELAERLSPAQFFVMYGQTEATARLAYVPHDELPEHPTSIGKAIPEVELQIRDQYGHPVPIGNTGELCARGPNVMLGYWRNAAATERVLKDGWLRTGDLATVDEDGFFYLVGRRSEQIKIRGLKVVPSEIADVLFRRLPRCGIAVVPFQLHGATRLALFVASETDPPFPHQVRQVCEETLSRQEMPSHIEVLDRLPRTPSLKVDYQLLAERAVRRVGWPSAAAAAETALTTEEGS